MSDINITQEDGETGGRYVTEVEGHEAELTYRRRPNGVLIATHTGVPKDIGGRGIAGHLTRRFLDDAKVAGVQIVPSCPYVDVWIKRHPEYEGLRA